VPSDVAAPSGPASSLEPSPSVLSGVVLLPSPGAAWPDLLDSMSVAQMNDRQGELVDAVAAGFAEVAAAQARCAQRVDDLRRWSEAATDAVARHQGKEKASAADHRLAERWLASEVACALRLPEGSASALLVESQSLVHEHPATLSALRQGEVSYRHAVTVVDATVGLDDTSRLELDVLLSERARTTTVAALKRVARRERERRDRRPLLERHEVAVIDRRVELQPCQDGMAWLHQYLPAVQATAIFHRLTDIAVAVRGPDEPRTLAQLRADASVDLLLDDDAREVVATATSASATASASASASAIGTDTAAGTAASMDTRSAGTTGSGTGTVAGAATHSSIDRGAQTAVADTRGTTSEPRRSIAGVADRISLGGIKPQVAVTVPVMTLLGLSDEPGDLAGHGPIDAHTARRLAAQAPSFLRILTHPETGAVLSVGRDRYAVPADLRSWLRLRDETCRFPGCSRRAQRCDIDHVKDWAHGGTTGHDNLIHLCRKHHRLKHTTGWTVSTGPPGGTSSGPSTRQASSPPDVPALRQESLHRALARGCEVPAADVVHWTTPSGRSYVDHAALPQGRGHDWELSLVATAPGHGGQSRLPDEPPF